MIRNVVALCALYLGVLNTIAFSQVFWTENFENGCTSNCLASGFSGANGAWSIVSTGANGSCPNTWFVSCAENGEAAGSCAAGCGSDESMHIASQSCSPWAPAFCPTGDCGAAYDAGNPCGAASFACLFGLCNCGATGAEVISNQAVVSPVINLTGKSGIVIDFNYIENGEGANDDANFQYFDGSIPGWVTQALGKTATCGAQGLWTAYSFGFPASIDGRSDFQIRFNWTNDANTLGADPSFAVDDITLTETGPLPVELSIFDSYCDNGTVLFWQTESERNNDFFSVETSENLIDWKEVSRVSGAGTSTQSSKYSIPVAATSGLTYFRLSQVDYDGNKKIYPIISSECHDFQADFSIYPNPSEGIIHLSIPQGWNTNQLNYVISTPEGKTVLSCAGESHERKNTILVDARNLANGIYLVRVYDGQQSATRRLVIRH